MALEVKPLTQITEEAIRVLCREMGPADAVRFLSQFTAGHGDYTAERDQLFADLQLDDMICEIKRTGS